jgi:type I restriction enzyme S subunit
MTNEPALNGVDQVSADAEMPEGWAAATLEDIGELYCGQSPATQFVNTNRVGTPYITGPDQWDGNDLHVDKWTSDPRRIVPDGCVFVTVKGAGVGTIFPGVPGAIGRDIYAFSPAVDVHHSFVRRALEFTVSEIKRNAAGDIPGLSKDHLLKHYINIPPYEEQKRIVAAIDNLFVVSKSARDRLSRVPLILKRFRQAVLAAARSGKLTEDWRERNSALSNTVADFVAGLVPGASSDCVPSEDDQMELFDIPSRWVWARCEHLCDPERAITYGVIKLGHHVKDGIPILRSSNVRWLRIDEENVKCISRQIASDYERTFLKGGEILVTVRGTLGGVAVVPSHLAGYNISREVAVLPINNSLRPDFICYAIAANWSQMWLSQVSKGVAYTGVNIRDLKRLPVPVPPTTEQEEIVRRVKALFELAERIDQQASAATLKVGRLTQSILAKAFRGELVPTEAELARRESRDYEPASVLLERIRKNRESQAIVKTRQARGAIPRGGKRGTVPV